MTGVEYETGTSVMHAGLYARPESTTRVQGPDADVFGPVHYALVEEIEAYSEKGSGLFSKRWRAVEVAAEAWAAEAEAWVAGDPPARGSWIESWLWGCEFKLFDLGDDIAVSVIAEREAEGYRLWWQYCLSIWSRYAPEGDRRLRRETKWWVTSFSRGSCDLYLTGFRRGLLPEGTHFVQRILCQLLGWSDSEADAIANRATHIGPQLVASQISEEEAIAFKVTLEESMKFKIKTAAASSSRSSGRRKPIPEQVRHEVWRRDEGQCVDCGSRERLEFDHIIPVSRGGSNTARNLELRCEACNRRKAARI